MGPLLDRPFRAQIGPYWLLLPGSAHISAQVKGPTPMALQMALTNWVVLLGRFQLFIHLDPINDLSKLKFFIDCTTKNDVFTPSVTVNGIEGVSHGDYGPQRTWIDWWFKKGDTMICLSPQSVTFPSTTPTEVEIAQHNAIVNSLKYCRDFPSERPPLPQ